MRHQVEAKNGGGRTTNAFTNVRLELVSREPLVRARGVLRRPSVPRGALVATLPREFSILGTCAIHTEHQPYGHCATNVCFTQVMRSCCLIILFDETYSRYH